MKVAFVYYPHFPKLARLETMPFALNSVVALDRSGLDVDLFLWEDENAEYSQIFSRNVTIKLYKEPDNLSMVNKLINKARIRAYSLRFQFQFLSKYDCVFGLGQIGAYIASILSDHSQCPFVYYNDEFPSQFEDNSTWTKIECEIVKKSTLVVVPDEQRFPPLCQELNITSKPHVSLPNIPEKQSTENINWHQRLSIHPNSIPLLHAGSVADWVQIPEILSSVPYWPEKTVLIIHTRSSKGMIAYRKQLSHLNIPDRIFWSMEPMSGKNLNSLVAYCAANFALYRNSGANIEYMGFSSGKLMRSLAYGSPVIASNFRSLRFIEQYQLGSLVNHPSEIPKSIKKILKNREAYSQRCLNFCNNYTCFTRSWNELCLTVKYLTGLDLT